MRQRVVRAPRACAKPPSMDINLDGVGYHDYLLDLIRFFQRRERQKR